MPIEKNDWIKQREHSPEVEASKAFNTMYDEIYKLKGSFVNTKDFCNGMIWHSIKIENEKGQKWTLFAGYLANSQGTIRQKRLAIEFDVGSKHKSYYWLTQRENWTFSLTFGWWRDEDTDFKNVNPQKVIDEILPKFQLRFDEWNKKMREESAKYAQNVEIEEQIDNEAMMGNALTNPDIWTTMW